MIHDLKIEKNYLKNLISGRKRSEVRINDRDYQTGDTLRFREYPFVGETIEHLFEIKHIHSGLGMKDNYVVLSVVHLAS